MMTKESLIEWAAGWVHDMPGVEPGQRERFVTSLRAELDAREMAGDRFFVDHGMIHDRKTGRHVDLDAVDLLIGDRLARCEARVERFGQAGGRDSVVEKWALERVRDVLVFGRYRAEKLIEELAAKEAAELEEHDREMAELMERSNP